MKLDTFIHGDCLEVMKSFTNECVDLVITSPPYNLKNSTGNGLKSPQGKWKNAALKNGYKNHEDAMDYTDYVNWQRSCLTEMLRLIKPTGAIFYNHKRRVQDGLIQDPIEIINGFPLRQIIIWKRKGGLNFNSKFFLPTYELVYLICKPKFKLAEKGNRFGDVWEISQDLKNEHPAPFPVALPELIIRATDAEIILDPFMGSGSTALAAKRCKKSFIGIELTLEYINQAKLRLQYDQQTSKFDL